MSHRVPAEVIFRAEFNPKLKTYWIVSTLFICLCTVVLIPLIPLIIPLMLWRMGALFDAMECYMTERSLVIKKGVWFRTEKTVPLNKVQDLSLRHGPPLNYFALSSLTIETAGQSGGGAGAGDAILTGIVNTEDFRDRVLHQRDLIEAGAPTARKAEGATASPAMTMTMGDAASSPEAIALLREIRDSLKRLEEK